MRLWTPAALAALAALIAAPAIAEELTAEAIIERMTARNTMGFESGTAHVRMLLQSKAGEQRERAIVSKARKDDGLARTLIRFQKPADVQGTAFLMLEQRGDDNDDMYLYLPALKRTRRIAGTQKGGAFMGSDFTYRDMESRDVKNSTYTKHPDETLDGVDCYRIDAVPKTGEDEYSKLEIWVRKADFLPQQIKFYDRKQRFLKVFKLHETRALEGSQVITKSQMWTQKNGHSTFLFIDALDTKTPVEATEFTPENMPKG